MAKQLVIDDTEDRGKIERGAIRTDVVARVRAEIEGGSYEDDHKLDVAVERLLIALNIAA